jgi:hypothetical protein
MEGGDVGFSPIEILSGQDQISIVPGGKKVPGEHGRIEGHRSHKIARLASQGDDPQAPGIVIERLFKGFYGTLHLALFKQSDADLTS